MILPFDFSLAAEAARLREDGFARIDERSDLVAVVRRGAREIPIKNGYAPINRAANLALAEDKACASLILERHGFQLPEGGWFSLAEPAGGLEAAVRCAERLGYPVFVKPDRGTLGHLAQAVADADELVAHLRRISAVYEKAIVQRFVRAPEYRVVVLDGEIQFAYRKRPAAVQGDGRRSFEELLADLPDSPAHGAPRIDAAWIEAELRAHGLGREAAVPAGVEIRLSSAANLAAGSSPEDLRFSLPEPCRAWAAAVAEALGLRLCGIDLFAPSGLDGGTEELIVIEVNSNPSLQGICRLGHRDLAVRIWARMLDACFDDLAVPAPALPAPARPSTARPVSGWARLREILQRKTAGSLDHDVVIIGAGLSGLMAAEALADLEVVVLDREARAGGRVLTRRRHGVAYDLGAVFACDTDLLPFPLPGVRLLREGRRLAIFWEGRLHTGDSALECLDSLDFSASERAALQRFVSDLRCTARDLPERVERALQALFQVIHAGEMRDYLPERQRDGLRDLPEYRLAGGNGTVVEHFQERLGSRLRLETEVRGVAEREGRVEVRAVVQGREVTFSARTAVLAVPAPVARGLLETAQEPAASCLAAVKEAPGTVVALGSRRFRRADLACIVTPDLASSSVLLQRHGEERVLLIYFVGSEAARRQTRDSALVVREALEIAARLGLGDLAPEDLSFSDVQHWPSVGPVISSPHAAWDPAVLRPSPRVFLAGDFAFRIPYGMRAALQAGRQAARAVRAHLRSETRKKDFEQSRLVTAHVYDITGGAPRSLESRDECNIAFYGLLLQAERDPDLIEYLLAHSVDGLWEYQTGFGVTAEDSALVLEGLLAAGVAPEILRPRVARLVKRFYRADPGAFLTVRGGRARYWEGPSVDATALAGDLLQRLDPEGWSVEVEACARFLLDRQGDDGSWQGKWFPSRLVTTRSAVRLLCRRPADLAAPALERAARSILAQQRPDGSWSGSVIDTAAAVLALGSLETGSAAQEKGRAWLESRRRAWVGEPVLYYWFELPDGTKHFYHCVDKGAITAAWARLALKAASDTAPPDRPWRPEERPAPAPA